MAHGSTVLIKVNELLDVEPLDTGKKLNLFSWLCVSIGALTFGCGIVWATPQRLWACYLVSLLFFMGLSCGSVVLTAIFQVVHAKWSSPLSRIAEAGVSFLPLAYVLWICTYFGAKYIYPWGTKPMAGKEWWMQPDFVYGRFAVLLAVLFLIMWKFVKMSLRADVGFLRERSKRSDIWGAYEYNDLVKGWEGSDVEITKLQRSRSWYAPLIIALYGVIYSLFAFEMVMSLDSIWYSNMYGAFTFLGNIYMAWATLGIIATYLMKQFPQYAKLVHQDQFHDLGKMTFAFCMLWGYTFWSQFLPQWYGNLPEETQWLILRTREYPWKGLAWIVFPLAFIVPFISLLGRDIKRVPRYFIRVCFVILAGVWLEKYIFVMPQFTPDHIPFGFLEVGIFLGFLGSYIICVRSFIAKYPFVQLSHPATSGHSEW